MRPNILIYSVLGAGLAGFVLFIGKDLLIPLVVATMVWYLVNILNDAFGALRLGGRRISRSLCFLLSLATIASFAFFFINLMTANIADFIAVAPSYQLKFQYAVRKIFSYLPIDEPPSLMQLLASVDARALLSRTAMALTGAAGNTSIIIIYALFLFLEQKSFKAKFNALFVNRRQRVWLIKIIRHINADIRTYIGIKTLASLVTALASYVIMAILDLDFAIFWAILIFVLNYIPTIGSIIATLFPALLALVQFDSLVPFVVIGGGITSLQFLIGNILEPRFMGNRLNLSPLIILLSLALWGSLWGITGMFLSVPLTAIAMIIFSHFPQTRAIAIVLSRNGIITERLGNER
jgi:predicted PurR-regulated permease PerM